MLSVLRSIVQDVNAAQNLDQALAIIVRRVKDTIAADVCSVYLSPNEVRELVLMATNGLDESSVGKVRLDWHQGLVGLVAERAEPINLGNAPEHPRYIYFPETGEEHYPAFLGVPVIHHRKVLGVMVVQQHAERPYDEDTVTFMVTIAAQLAGAIIHAEASGGISGLRLRPSVESRPLPGQPGAPGIAIGTTVVIHPHADIDSIPDRGVDDVEAERERLLRAIGRVRGDVRDMVQRMSGTLPAGDSALFDAYLMMLDSDSFLGSTLERINAGNWAPAALRDTIHEHARAFDAMEDPYLRERAQDVRDLGRRILHRLREEAPQEKRDYPKDTVLVGEEITASMIAEVPPERLAGIVSVRGSRTSHAAILARAIGVPAVMGANDLPISRIDGYSIIADGYGGRVYVNPSSAVRREYLRLRREEAQLSAELSSLRDLPSETLDGVRIPLLANTGLVSDIRPSLNSGAEGIGLYRTEFPFMIRERFPGEEEQRQVYRQVLESFSPRPVTMRTLDVGGDKALPYFPIEEDNPFLGWRGLRITLDHPEIFMVQIRAMLRANVGLDNLRLLLPMVSSVGEVDEALDLIRRAHAELLEEGVPVSMPQSGVMLEVPSAVFQAERLASRVDFLSVGTNDLTQYLLAVDRNNSRVAELYEPLHPAVLQALNKAVEGAHAQGKPVSVCGEMAGDPAAAVLLVGMGMDALSMSASSLLRIKSVVRSFTIDRAQALLNEVLAMEEAHQVRERVNVVLEQANLGGLVRAGR